MAESHSVLSSHRPLRVLIVEDNERDAELMVAALKRAGYLISFERVDRPEDFQRCLSQSNPEVVLSDHNLRTWTAKDALKILLETRAEIPFVVVTERLGDEAAVEYIKSGAADYVLKQRLDRLTAVVGQALRAKAHRDEEARLHDVIQAGKREWELTFDSVPDPIFLLGQDCRIRRANRAAAETLGLNFNQLIGRPCQEAIHGQPEMCLECPHQGALESGEERRCDINDDRLNKIFDAICTPTRTSSGEILGFVFSMRDVTEHRRADEALVRLRKAVNASGEVVFTTDREGTINFINPEFTRLYGYSEAEVVGRATPRILKSGTAQPEQYAALWGTILSKRMARWQGINKAKDGRLVNVEGTINPILDEQGNISGFLAIQRDVTARNQLEAQLRQAQKMEAVGRLAGGVAHDFNNLLTVISGRSYLALEKLPAADSAKESIEEVMRAADRAAALTRQLLAFSRQQVMQPVILDLNSIVANMEKLLRRLIGEDIALSAIYGKGLGSLKADPGQIEQVIMNLAVNSRDAMPKGGELRIETQRVVLDEARSRTHFGIPSGPYVMVAVRDTGFGMDEQTQAHIFEPFFTTKEPGKGTGLGLATVYGIVKQTGGHIWVHSELGEGTTFEVYFPEVTGETITTTAREKVREQSAGGTETILLVEDEGPLRKMAREILKAKGYRVIEAENGRRAMELAGNHRRPIHLMITDVVMPGMSGRELAEQLAPRFPLMKVLFMSGYADDAIVRGGALGPDVAFLQKPFSPDAIARKVREVLSAAKT